MRFKKQRYWLASKILGGAIVTDTQDLVNDAVDAAHHEWVKDQLNKGNSITLEYKITALEDEKKKRLTI